MRTPSKRNNRGFTLIEVMVALTIFVMLTVVFASTVPLARKSARLNGQHSQALSFCQHKIDQLRAVGYGRLNYTELSDAGIIDSSRSTQPYRFSTVDGVEEVLIEPSTSLYIVQYGTDQLKATVTVTWKTTNHESKQSTASLSAIIANVE